MGLRFVGTMTKFLKCCLTLTPWGHIFLVQLTSRQPRGLVTFWPSKLVAEKMWVKTLRPR